MFGNTNVPGSNTTFPDVCTTPGPGGPVPVPSPNMTGTGNNHATTAVGQTTAPEGEANDPGAATLPSVVKVILSDM
jgi:hypothetical protein